MHRVPRQEDNRESGEKPERSRHCKQVCFPEYHWVNKTWEGGKMHYCESGDLPDVLHNQPSQGKGDGCVSVMMPQLFTAEVEAFIVQL